VALRANGGRRRRAVARTVHAVSSANVGRSHAIFTSILIHRRAYPPGTPANRTPGAYVLKKPGTRSRGDDTQPGPRQQLGRRHVRKAGDSTFLGYGIRDRRYDDAGQLREYQRQARFQEAIAPEVNRLFRLALAIVDDSGEAEEAVQETLLIAWRRWSSLLTTRTSRPGSRGSACGSACGDADC